MEYEFGPGTQSWVIHFPVPATDDRLPEKLGPRVSAYPNRLDSQHLDVAKLAISGLNSLTFGSTLATNGSLDLLSAD